jgi:hypothetical protein
MTTHTSTHPHERTQRIWDLMLQLYSVVSEAIYDVTTTVIALSFAVVIYSAIASEWLMTWAAFTTGSIYVVLMMLRIMRRMRQDGAYTLDEIGERLVQMDHELNEKIDEVCRNV